MDELYQLFSDLLNGIKEIEAVHPNPIIVP